MVLGGICVSKPRWDLVLYDSKDKLCLMSELQGYSMQLMQLCSLPLITMVREYWLAKPQIAMEGVTAHQ